MQDEKPTFTQEDLAVLGADGDTDTTDKDEGAADDTAGAGKDDTAGKGAEAGKAGDTVVAGGDKGDDKGAVADGKAKTLVGGADGEADDKAAADKAAADKAAKPSYWPKDWRESAAKHLSAGDKKVYDKELKRLQRYADPIALAGSQREAERLLSGGGLVKIPGKDAKPEEVSAFAKALGWSDKPEEMLAQVKLENGAVLGEADKPAVTGFLSAVHGATSAADFVNKATGWYFKQQEEQAAAQDEADDTHRRESEASLKEELGPAYKRNINAIGVLFAEAPGGADVKNPNSLYAQLMGGRTADGKLIGNHPDVVRFLIKLVNDAHPEASVVESGAQGGLSIDAEIAQIEKIMRTNRREYNEKHAGRYLELLAVREKSQARKRA